MKTNTEENKNRIKDIKTIIQYFKDNGHDTFGSKYLGYDAGRDNLVDHFCVKLGWTRNKLKSLIKDMVEVSLLIYHKGQSTTTQLYSFSGLLLSSIETHLKLL